MTHTYQLDSIGEIEFFADTTRRLCHLRDHVVTATECYAWALIFAANETPLYEDIVGGLDFKARARYIDSLFKHPDDETLYNAYVQSIKRGLIEANRTQWIVTTLRDMVALTTDGMMIFGRRSSSDRWTITTAYVAGMGHAQDHERHDSGQLKREMSKQLWPAPWTEDWRTPSEGLDTYLYRKVFRPAYRHLINRFDSNLCAQRAGRPSMLDTFEAELLKTLQRRPPTFEQWQEKRNDSI